VFTAYTATRARSGRSDRALSSGSGCTAAPSSGQQPQGGLRSNASQPAALVVGEAADQPGHGPGGGACEPLGGA
jgi:hypothetical protein